ncbi:uncharacterized protein LOC110856327 [Folsomia candida]|uniref:Uncharacterized protein n=1 Tax=Folsomia candida TaxID=158441 RepID=A0A226DMT8_FOLCA|nr:uncharacterized protein LOC110856327 [Folsomia candida]OXA46328.1 hypothetical protein Fcan01_18571 [Folsomia candida]
MKNMERIRARPIVKQFRRGFRKPSIKITVSADTPPELYNNSSPARTPSPQTVIKRVLTFGPGPDGIQYDDENNDEAFTRITVDDSVVDFPNCVDFGIKDFLCYKDEIDLELSSDDTSFLEATPPHRFSDSELESQIEIMSITLDNVLNLYPKRSSFSKDDNFTFDLLRLENQMISDIDQDDTRRRFEDENAARIRNFSITTTTTSAAGGRRLPPPPRPFRRNISLPASIFMSYLMAEQNFKNKEKRTSLQQQPKEFFTNERFSSRKLTKIDGSYSSNESTEAEESTSPINDTGNNEEIDSSSMAEESESGDSRRGGGADTPLSAQNADLGAMIMSGAESGEEELDREDEQAQQAFTSDIERKSLVLRYMRKLVRQDTSGNFAPPDYCI